LPSHLIVFKYLAAIALEALKDAGHSFDGDQVALFLKSDLSNEIGDPVRPRHLHRKSPHIVGKEKRRFSVASDV
jgi:hypothetical protein